MLLIFLGAPGSGKGTMSEIMSRDNGFTHISTGDIFRKIIRSGSELGNRVKSIIEGGQLVDDQTTWEVAKTALDEYDLNETNLILDGYPRNIDQGKELEKYVIEKNIDDVKAVFFDVEDENILLRLTGRMMCKVCGKSYHKTFMPPKVENVCDKDGGELYQREDDKEENIKVRLNTYAEVTQPLIDFYNEQGRLITVDANREKEEITKETLIAIK